MPSVATWMDLEIIILSEVSQTEKCHMISLICVTKKNNKSKLIYKTDYKQQQQQQKPSGYQRGMTDKSSVW